MNRKRMRLAALRRVVAFFPARRRQRVRRLEREAEGMTAADFDEFDPERGAGPRPGDADRGWGIRAVFDRRYPLEDVVEATRYVETGQKSGNVVLTAADDAEPEIFTAPSSILNAGAQW